MLRWELRLRGRTGVLSWVLLSSTERTVASAASCGSVRRFRAWGFFCLPQAWGLGFGVEGRGLGFLPPALLDESLGGECDKTARSILMHSTTKPMEFKSPSST